MLTDFNKNMNYQFQCTGNNMAETIVLMLRRTFHSEEKNAAMFDKFFHSFSKKNCKIPPYALPNGIIH